MKSEVILFTPVSAKSSNKSTTDIFLITAFIGIAGWFFASFFGFIATLLHAVIRHDTIFNQTGTILMIVSIPLILVGSHFMDKATEKRK